MNAAGIQALIGAQWDAEIVPEITEYIRIPARSPHFDPQWDSHGHIERVVRQAERWVRAQPVKGLTCEIVRLPGRTPLLFFEVPANGGAHGTVLLYGHLDKQPEMTGDGARTSVPGRRNTRAAGSTAAAAPTTVTPCTRRSRRSGRCRRRTCRMRAAWA